MDKLHEAVYIAIGHASMCWGERPRGVFDGEEASRCAATLLAAIEDHVTEAIKRDRAVQHLSHPHIIRDAQGSIIAQSKQLGDA